MSDKAQKSVRRDRRERVLRRDVRIHGDVLALLVRAPAADAHVVPPDPELRARRWVTPLVSGSSGVRLRRQINK